MNLYNNRYEKIRYLGKGVTGEVSLVRDTKTGQNLALKILHAPLGQVKRMQLEALRGEFQILKNLHHPTIAKVYDTGLNQEDKRFYMLSEFIEGKDLFEGTEGSPIEVIEDLFVQGLRALNYLHNQQVYHFDIKPNNLLVTADKNGALQLKIIDFGFANFYEQEFAKTHTQDTLPIIGTPAYMAPEIIKKEPHDGRADLYSLACSFYKAFTRQLPFQGSQDEVYHKQLTEKPAPPSSLKPSIPPYLDQIFLKLLEKDPANRYLSGQEVIKDLNIQSKKNYEVETFETAVSYLPQRGRLIGREKEFEKFREYFADRLYLKSLKKKPYLIITGPKGTGKTRFLEECKHQAYQHFIQVFTADEAQSFSMDQIPSPCLVIGDDWAIEKGDLEYYEICYQEIPLLSVLTSSQKYIPCDPENIIELKNFSQEETQEYLIKAMGLVKISPKDLEAIFKMTGGNPWYLSGVVRILFKNRKIRDGHGNWSQKIYEDLGLNLEETGVEEFIKQGLREEINALKLDLGHSQVLNMLALAGKPTLNDLQSMSGNFSVDEALVRLAEAGILKVDAENLYVFTNPLYKEIILEKMDPEEKSEYCDLIADYYESQKANPETILYFRGRGNDSKAASSLTELARIQRERADYHLAHDNLELLLATIGLDANLENSALLEIGEIDIETGKYNEAEKYFERVVMNHQNSQQSASLPLIKALEQMGVCHHRRQKPKEATYYFNKALDLAQKDPQFLWMEVILKNRLARNALDSGHLDEAEKLFGETWKIWKEQLKGEEQILAAKTDIDLLYFTKSDFAKAVAYLQEILQVVSKKPSSDSYPLVLYKLGKAYFEMDEIEKSKSYLSQCIEIMKKRHMPHLFYATYNELGRLYEKQKNMSQALEEYQHAFDLAQRTTADLHHYIVAFNMANIYRQEKKWKNAQNYYHFVITSLRVEGTHGSATSSYYIFASTLGLAEIHQEQKEFAHAQDYLNQAHELLKRVEYLKLFEQHYYQAKAELELSIGNRAEFDKTLAYVEALKSQEGFNLGEFEDWKKRLSI